MTRFYGELLHQSRRILSSQSAECEIYYFLGGDVMSCSSVEVLALLVVQRMRNERIMLHFKVVLTKSYQLDSSSRISLPSFLTSYFVVQRSKFATRAGQMAVLWTITA
jgi:hypothetical protein